MQMPLETSDSEQDLPERVDLTDVANAHPVNQKIAVLDLNTFDATQLTLLEVLDMAETVGVEPEALGVLMEGKQNSKRMRLLYAMAWCIARRADPALTFDDICTWKLEVIGEVQPEHTERIRKRAALVVGAASMSGLPPSEAGNLTVAELGAYTDRARRRNKRR